MITYAAAAALLVILGVSGALYMQTQKADALLKELEATELQLGACDARVINLLEDMKSDRSIDDIPDNDLGNVPSHWLREREGGEP